MWPQLPVLQAAEQVAELAAEPVDIPAVELAEQVAEPVDI